MRLLDVLVVDDEPLARRRVLRLLRQLPWVGSIAEAANVPQALAQLDRLDAQILLLDIQMPGGTGFDLLARISGRPEPPAVVFVTAFDDQACRAFDASATDYITKPIEPGRFHLALDRARRATELQSNAGRIAELEEVIATLRRSSQPQSAAVEIWVKTRGEYVRLAASSITRIQAEGDYARIYAEGREYLHNATLSELKNQLPVQDFVRIHRSTMVRAGEVVRLGVGSFSSLTVVLADGAVARVGRTYTSDVRARFMARK
ncbi:MAG: response regulator transcription factor [Comamonadaceae bacterium]|nr:response regulator transcription factor [Comamonadaceae bacterium]